MNRTAELLFNYLRDVIYKKTGEASLDIEALEKDFRDFGKGLVFFVKMIEEQKEFAAALAKGDLGAALPSRDNEMAAPLKALHSGLKHMTWQSQQIAKGDYSQRVDFLGEFSEAFNTMTEQLAAHREALMQEVEYSNKKTQELEQSYRMLVGITSNMPQIILVASKKTGEILYRNKTAETENTEDLLGKLPGLPEDMKLEDLGKATEITAEVNGKTHYYTVQIYELPWEGSSARAFVIDDISETKELVLHAYQDGLTKLHNRFFGMQLFYGWIGEGKAFAFCFIDLDNLKCVNDTLGHEEGNYYLKTSAKLMEQFSPETVACRIGGDEFMLLIPGMNEEQVEARMQEQNQRLQEIINEDGKKYRCSMSYGIVMVDNKSTLSSSDILNIADEKMYSFKRKNKRARMI